jgi:hypothetical protein
LSSTLFSLAANADVDAASSSCAFSPLLTADVTCSFDAFSEISFLISALFSNNESNRLCVFDLAAFRLAFCGTVLSTVTFASSAAFPTK